MAFKRFHADAPKVSLLVCLNEGSIVKGLCLFLLDLVLYYEGGSGSKYQAAFPKASSMCILVIPALLRNVLNLDDR